MNSRHPGPRRVWKGGSEPQLLTPDNRESRDPRDPEVNPFWAEIDAQASKNEQGVALALCFSDFFMTASSKTYTFETIFGKTTSQNALEKHDSVRDIPQKVEKTSRDSLGGLRGSGQQLASRGQLWQSSGSSWEVLGELGRVFFSENKPPEGA